ncbi:mucosal pentraxin-like [Arapaima gigas]
MATAGAMGVMCFTLLLTSCQSDHEDLQGKVFTFPVQSSTSYVKVTPDVAKDFSTFTVCLRFFSDVRRPQSVLSLAALSHINGYGLYTPSTDSYGIDVCDATVFFWGLPVQLNEWVSLCGTWDSGTGLAQLWVNDKPSSRKVLSAGKVISGKVSIILGQEQDTLGGGFDFDQSFMGQLTDVHMWDSVLSPCEIRQYLSKSTFSPGNVINWRRMDYTKHGTVFVEKKEPDMCSYFK